MPTFPDLTLLKQQDELGWQAAFEGCWTKGWPDLQQTHYSALGSRRTGTRWLSAFIQRLWQFGHELWEHRNGTLHRGDSRLLSEIIDQQIRDEYMIGLSTLPTTARYPASLTLETVLKFRTTQKQMWLKRIQAARSFQKRQQAKRKQPLRRQTTLSGARHPILPTKSNSKMRRRKRRRGTNIERTKRRLQTIQQDSLQRFLRTGSCANQAYMATQSGRPPGPTD